jgi:hypothetical protein
MSLKESSWFGESNCKLSSKVVLFFVFFPSLFSFTFVVQILGEWKTCYGLKILLQLSHF